ncbi:MAG TPA: hypothetical protein VGC55_07655, partial [Dokdonella sp.]
MDGSSAGNGALWSPIIACASANRTPRGDETCRRPPRSAVGFRRHGAAEACSGRHMRGMAGRYTCGLRDHKAALMSAVPQPASRSRIERFADAQALAAADMSAVDALIRARLASDVVL